ncbi:chlorite dismutase family protein [Galbitalea sp. SE-J8]|uniref:hydrogen peroxide-dependent heme synthase n=1 Tax=Galbitalea sp. SE-J8 TaxID=3054952 RepID=UPI00259CFA54|nr:hydrogen peroxide-dependent heme synthase [Galbitalea sp. SE-J8]MDM4763318.1 chlorite dismutase family protein [Galbitalea sp. SE-J8]
MTDSATSAAEPTAASGDGFTLFAVLRRDPLRPTREGDPSTGSGRRLDEAIADVESAGVVIRGFYDTSGLRADADLMIWLHGADAQTLQWALRELRRSAALVNLLPTWNAMGVHRDAEFNRAHVPGFLRGERARDWLVVYPFDRSYDWYLLDDADRRRMLADHGRKGAAFRSVVANTVAAFALGDYEWILPMESDSLTDLVDMMRALRATEARLHVRGEVPFFTGRRIPASEVLEVLR